MRMFTASKKARIVLFGTGGCATAVLAALRSGVEVAAASDNSATRWGQRIGDVPIVSPAEIHTLAYDYVVVCSTWAADIVPPLVASGIARDRIVSCYEIGHNDTARQRELAILNRLFDLAAVKVPGLSFRPAASRGTHVPGFRTWLSACGRFLATWREGRSWYRVFRRLPIDRRIAFFDSYWGDGYSCNPRAISEHLANVTDGRRWKIVWGFTSPSSMHTPRAVVKVKHLGIAYHYYAARAGLLVSNVNFPDHIEKRSGSLHVQTMHGTPIKTLGLDIPGEFTTPKAKSAFLERCERWEIGRAHV